MQAQHPEPSHGILFANSRLTGMKSESTASLVKNFKNLPVSIYLLPDFNFFDFCVVGSLSEPIFKDKILNDRNRIGIARFGRSAFFEGKRLIYHGRGLDEESWPSDAPQSEAIQSVAFDDADQFHAMLLVGGPEYWIRKGELPPEKIIDILTAALNQSEISKIYCLSSMARVWNKVPSDYVEKTGLDLSPIGEYVYWVRIPLEIRAGEELCDVLTRLDAFHHNFKVLLPNKATSICFPAIPKELTAEFSSREDDCRATLAARFPNDRTEMLWYGFEREDSPEKPEANLILPLGNFIISAAAGSGKSSMMLAVADAFRRWRSTPPQGLQYSSGRCEFDLLYINLKTIGGAADENGAVADAAEAQNWKIFMGKQGVDASCVKPKDLRSYFERKLNAKESIAVYTESDGVTKWHTLIEKLSMQSQRGLLLIVDEAFQEALDSETKSELKNLYRTVHDTWRSRGVRIVLIGQEFSSIHEWLSDGLLELEQKSTLILGTQIESGILREVLVAGAASAEDVAETIRFECANLSKLNEVFQMKRDMPNYNAIPVISRPSLLGLSMCHAVPCHVWGIRASDEERAACDTSWWKNPSRMQKDEN